MPKPRKLPAREEVARLYVDEGMTTPQIAKMFGVSDPRPVRLQLLRAGISLRRSGPKRVEHCIEPGCTKPVHSLRHPISGSLYGKRCRYHRHLHYAWLNRNLVRVKRAIPYARWRWIFEIPCPVAREARLKVEADKDNLRLAEQTIKDIIKLVEEKQHGKR